MLKAILVGVCVERENGATEWAANVFVFIIVLVPVVIYVPETLLHYLRLFKQYNFLELMHTLQTSACLNASCSGSRILPSLHDVTPPVPSLHMMGVMDGRRIYPKGRPLTASKQLFKHDLCRTKMDLATNWPGGHCSLRLGPGDMIDVRIALNYFSCVQMNALQEPITV